MTFLLLSAAVISVLSGAALISAVKNASVGYENEAGFHEGTPVSPALASSHGLGRTAHRASAASVTA